MVFCMIPGKGGYMNLELAQKEADALFFALNHLKKLQDKSLAMAAMQALHKLVEERAYELSQGSDVTDWLTAESFYKKYLDRGSAEDRQKLQRAAYSQWKYRISRTPVHFWLRAEEEVLRYGRQLPEEVR